MRTVGGGVGHWCILSKCYVIMDKIAKFAEKYLRRNIFLTKLLTCCLHLIKKETPSQIFSSKLSKTFKNIFFTAHLQVTTCGACL